MFSENKRKRDYPDQMIVFNNFDKCLNDTLNLRQIVAGWLVKLITNYERVGR